ncbi:MULTISPECIES: hypothetical protein [Methylococcus]|uniref:DUF1640 domain-containing protein n=1 Tax=Methylococcus capsulatus TaxID=414 RepID=A0ABZ2F4P0_METCP|nr:MULTISPECIES: hypothetical protein [Methylococcus]MDF9392345.1 DUF1640 domain-containing protein [Methylococcus capsulatus]
MSVALRLYEQLTEAGEDKTRAKLIAEAFEHLEDRYPQLKDVATAGQVRETELRLQKEIKEVEGKLQKEIKEVEARLQKEIKEVEARLQKEIKEVELKLQKEIKEVEVRLTQAIHRQTLWVVGSVGAVVGMIRLLEWFLAHMPNP